MDLSFSGLPMEAATLVASARPSGLEAAGLAGSLPFLSPFCQRQARGW